MKNLRSEKGQTLVEAIVAIAVAVIIVTSLVSLGIGTQRAANTSRNQNQNTRYGEETIEIVRSIRDANLPGAFNSLTTFSCNPGCRFSDLFSNTQFFGTSGIYFSLPLAMTPGGCTGVVTTCWELSVVGNNSPQPFQGIYSRTIKISDSGNTTDPVDPAHKVKTVEVVISWTDAGGAHSSVTTTKLTNFR
jgi:type II secretory pathway pseudopilin PulG